MKTFLWKLLQVRELSIILLMLLFFLFVGSINRDFTSVDSIIVLVSGSIILLVLAVGQSFVLLTSHIDVSVGSIMGLCAAVGGTLLVNGTSLTAVILSVIGIGALCGLINGFGIAQLKIPAIIMTLGTLGILRGVMLIYTGGMWIESIPSYYKMYAVTDFLGLPYPIWIGIIICLVAYRFLNKTKFGRYFYAVGDNLEGARLVGLPVKTVEVLAFVFSGISAAIAALIFIMNIGFVPNQTGNGIELQVIAAAVLGGVSLSGGVGTVLGAALGAIFFTVINNSLVYMKIPAYWNNAISGLLLLLIVISDTKVQNYFTRRKQASINKRNLNSQRLEDSSP